MSLILLKYRKLLNIWKMRTGIARQTVPINTFDCHGLRKGLIFIQDTTLCSQYEIYRRAAVEERYQP